MELIKRFKARNPIYLTKYRESIIDRFTNVGKTIDENVLHAGKTFARVYEIYMYALIIGLRKDYKLPIPDKADTSTFIEIRSWLPHDIVDFIIAGLIARSDIDLIAIEDMEEDEIEKELTKLKKLMEEYAHGGFEMIERAIDDNPYMFKSDDRAFLELLDEIM